jgi:hypothetical protein
MEVGQLPPQMKEQRCAVAGCGQPSAYLVKFVVVQTDAYFEPACSTHGSRAAQVGPAASEDLRAMPSR